MLCVEVTAQYLCNRECERRGKELPAHLSREEALGSEGKGNCWTPLHQAFLLNIKPCEEKEFKTALDSRNSNSSTRLSYTDHIKLWEKIRSQNMLKKCCVFSLCFKLQVFIYTRFDLMNVFSCLRAKIAMFTWVDKPWKKIMLKWKIHSIVGSLAVATLI